MSLRNREHCFQLLRSLSPQIEVSYTSRRRGDTSRRRGDTSPAVPFNTHEIRPCRTAAPTAAPSSPPLRTVSTKANWWYVTPPPTVRSRGFDPLARGDIIPSMSPQNTSLSSLDDSVDQLDGSESQSSQHPPLQKAHRGQRSRRWFLTQRRSSALTSRPVPVLSRPSRSVQRERLGFQELPRAAERHLVLGGAVGVR